MRMRMRRLLILTAVATLLAACAELQYYNSNGTIAPVIDSGLGVSRWLRDVHATHAMSPELLQQTLETWEQEYRDNPSVTNRMRLALLLATGEESVRDRPRARKLLNGAEVWTGSSESEQELVAIMQQFLDEQGESSGKINILRKQVTEQNRRIEELEEQLQALTTIEHDIQQRDKPVVIEEDGR